MADVTTNAHGSVTTEKNYSIIVGAPKAAKSDALGSNYIITSGNNDAADVAGLDSKYDGRFDDVRYYTGDSA